MTERPRLSRRQFLRASAGGLAVLPALSPRPRRRLRERADPRRSLLFPTPCPEPDLLSEGPSDAER